MAREMTCNTSKRRFELHRDEPTVVAAMIASIGVQKN